MKTFFMLMVVLALPSFGQKLPMVSDPMQALLVEVRLLRQDIEAVTVASRRVQIALYSLQLQDAAVAREGQRLDATRAKCSSMTENRRRTAGRVSQIEDVLGKIDSAAPEWKDFQAELTNLKKGVSGEDTEVQACQGEEAERMSQFQKEQAQMRALRGRIEALDQAL